MSTQAAGWTSLGDGVDNGNHPLILSDTYCADAVNVSFRSGFPTTRPGFDRLAFRVPCRKYQGAAFYASEAGPILVAAADGRVTRMHLRTGGQDELTARLGSNLPHVDRMTFCQADRFFLVQDGRNLPLILDGLQSRRADMRKPSRYSISSQPDKIPIEYFKGEIPPFYHMAYGQGRLALAQRGTNEVFFADILALGHPENILMFTENFYLNEGGSFKLPDHIGEITGMQFIPVASSSTGLGPLVVHGKGGIVAFDISGNRSQWSSSARIGSVIYQGPGCLGPRAQVANARDLYFMAEDGIRSVRQSVGNVASEALDYSLSREADGYTASNQAGWMHGAAMAYADRRLFATVCPTADGYFGGLLVADLSLSTTARRSTKPAFNGIWTLPERIVDVCAVDAGRGQQILVVTKKEDFLSFWLMNPAAKTDDGEPICSRLVSRSVIGSGGFFVDRTLDNAKLWLESVDPGAIVWASFRPDQEESWSKPQQVYTRGQFTGMPSSTATPGRERGVQVGVQGGHSIGISHQLMVEWRGRLTITGGQLNTNVATAMASKACGQKSVVAPLTNPTPSPYNLGV